MPKGIPRSVIHSDDIHASIPEVQMAGFDVSDIEVVSGEKAMSKAAEAKFMEEKVVVFIEADDNPNSPHFVYSGHQGVVQYIERGTPQAIKRKFLYSLLAAKRVMLACAFGRDANGNEFNRLTPNAQRTHRINIIEDKNPMGGAKWAQSIG